MAAKLRNSEEDEMAGGNFDQGLGRVSSKEKSQQPQGRSGAGTPKMGLKGDSNPTKSGGINRPTQGYRKD